MRISRLLPVLALLCGLAPAPSARGAFVVGGWDAARGGDSALVGPGGLGPVRADLDALFPGTQLVGTATLTADFLATVDLVILGVVRGVNNVPIVPLSAEEQQALVRFVDAGGSALLVTDNVNFAAAGTSLVQPFGPVVAQDSVAGVQPGTVINRTAFPGITQGPFGTVTTIRGGAIGGYSAPGPATPLATFDINGTVAVAAQDFGAGRVAFFGDYDLVSRDERDNVALRRNTLSDLLTPSVPEPGSLALGATGAVVLLGGAWLRRRSPRA